MIFGKNSKGGVDDEECKKFILGSFIPPFLDVKNIHGNHIMIKIVNSPSRLQHLLLVNLWLFGVHKYQGVPNTTAVTQDANQNYAPFNFTFQSNLDYAQQQ